MPDKDRIAIFDLLHDYPALLTVINRAISRKASGGNISIGRGALHIISPLHFKSIAGLHNLNKRLQYTLLQHKDRHVRDRCQTV